MSHTTLRWVVNVSIFPPVPLQIEVWAVSNLTFVLLSFAILHSTTEVPFIFLALYFHRSDTLKRVNGDATSAVCRLGKYVSVALHAIANCLWIHEMIVRNTMKQKLLTYLFLNEIHVVEMCEAGRYKSFVRITIYSAMWYYLWGVQFVYLNTNDYMMRPLPVSCFVISFSYWTWEKSAVWFQLFQFDSEVWATKTSQNTTREKRCTPRKFIV